MFWNKAVESLYRQDMASDVVALAARLHEPSQGHYLHIRPFCFRPGFHPGVVTRALKAWPIDAAGFDRAMLAKPRSTAPSRDYRRRAQCQRSVVASDGSTNPYTAVADLEIGAAALLLHGDVLRSKFKLVLASASPRRREILGILGLPFDIVTSGFAEDLDKARYTPSQYAKENAMLKCEAVLKLFHKEDLGGQRVIVIGSDTVVTVDGKILEKPADAKEAKRMLTMLSGRTHEVLTGVAIAIQSSEGSTTSRATRSAFVESTEVTFGDLSDAEIEGYIATGEPFDKAGGYGIQSRGALLVTETRGDHFNVVGFPLRRFSQVLAEMLVSEGA